MDHHDSIAMASLQLHGSGGSSGSQPKSARGMFSHVNTPRQPRSARGGGGNHGPISDRNHAANSGRPPGVPPLNFGGVGGSARNLNDGNVVGASAGEVHFDIDKLSALAKANPEVARELALGLAMRMSEEMNRSASEDEDGSDDDDINDGSGHHQITIHDNGSHGMGQRRTSSGMRSARLALEALGGVPPDFRSRLASSGGSGNNLSSPGGGRRSGGGAPPTREPSSSVSYDHTSGAPKIPHRQRRSRAERAERRQREKKMLLSGRRNVDITTAMAAAAAATTSPSTATALPMGAKPVHQQTRNIDMARTPDDLRGDGWEPSSARSLPVIGRDENGIQVMIDRPGGPSVVTGATDESDGFGALPPPRTVKKGSVPSASAVTEDDDDEPVPVHIRHQPNPFGDDDGGSQHDVKRSPLISPATMAQPGHGTTTIGSVISAPSMSPVSSSIAPMPPPSVPVQLVAPSHLRPNGAVAAGTPTTAAAAIATPPPTTTTTGGTSLGPRGWVSPMNTTPSSPLSPPSPPFARPRGGSVDDAELSPAPSHPTVSPPIVASTNVALPSVFTHPRRHHAPGHISEYSDGPDGISRPVRTPMTSGNMPVSTGLPPRVPVVLNPPSNHHNNHHHSNLPRSSPAVHPPPPGDHDDGDIASADTHTSSNGPSRSSSGGIEGIPSSLLVAAAAARNRRPVPLPSSTSMPSLSQVSSSHNHHNQSVAPTAITTSLTPTGTSVATPQVQSNT
jgi:hypothetical protein